MQVDCSTVRLALPLPRVRDAEDPEIQPLKEHLEHCPDCRERDEAEMTVFEHLARSTPPPAPKILRDRIRVLLDREDRHRRGAILRYSSAAAVVLLGIGVATSLRWENSSAPLLASLLDLHEGLAKKNFRLCPCCTGETARAVHMSRIRVDPCPSARCRGFAAARCPRTGRPMETLVYDWRGTPLTMTLLPKEAVQGLLKGCGKMPEKGSCVCLSTADAGIVVICGESEALVWVGKLPSRELEALVARR